MTEDKTNDDIAIPSDYLGIPFQAWLDIFLEYSLLLACDGDIRSAYEVLSAAYDANVFFHSQDSMFYIHVCWFSEFLRCLLDTQTVLSITQHVALLVMTKRHYVTLRVGS